AISYSSTYTLSLHDALPIFNTVEFAIKDGVPYAIDFMNPAPDAELVSVGEFYHHWVTNAVTNLVFKRLEEKREQPRYRWDALLRSEEHTSELQSLRHLVCRL